jgi:hypothetical protein
MALALPRFPDCDLVLVAPYGVCPWHKNEYRGCVWDLRMAPSAVLTLCSDDTLRMVDEVCLPLERPWIICRVDKGPVLLLFGVLAF